MQRTLSLEAKPETEITVAGWVNSRRDHGGLIFIDLRDAKGILQLVVTPEEKTAFKLAETVRDEFVLKATGRVRERAPELVNPNIATGKIELVVKDLELLNRSEPLPVNTHDDGPETGEDLRLKYRYLDLRRPYMQRMIAERSRFYQFLRSYMYSRDFVEVPTPILANSSPEGARDFLVPSRLKPGLFYALPQAPQQFKQLLMVGGVPRYFQIAPCFRDEDPRADRLYGDFYQLDLEIAFAESGEAVREEAEPLIINLVEQFAGKKLVLNSEPAKKYLTSDFLEASAVLELSDEVNTAIKSDATTSAESNTAVSAKSSADTLRDKVATLVPRLPYDFAMDTYGVDKPDLRYGLELIDLTGVFAKTDFKVFKTEVVKAIRVPGAASLTRSQIDNFTDQARKLGAGGLAYITYDAEGNEKSPIAKFLTPEELQQIREKTGAAAGDAVFFGADTREKVNKVLGQLRIAFADYFNLKHDDEIALCWITDFPFYEWNENMTNRETGKLGTLDFGHNPFSMPKGGLEALNAAKTDEDRLKIVADQYDMVMNGYEICSGAVRNHNPEVMYAAFGALGYDEKYVEERFGGMLSAFKFGAPPHAGCAFGIDRIFMVLEDAKNIRDIVAFPKNGSGIDLMMNSPSPVDLDQLKDAHISILDED